MQGFDYAKQHMGQQGEETVAVTKETLVLSLPVRDAPLTQDKGVLQDGTASKRPQSTDIHRRSVCFATRPENAVTALVCCLIYDCSSA